MVRAGLLTASQLASYDHFKHTMLDWGVFKVDSFFPAHVSSSIFAGIVCGLTTVRRFCQRLLRSRLALIPFLMTRKQAPIDRVKTLCMNNPSVYTSIVQCGSVVRTLPSHMSYSRPHTSSSLSSHHPSMQLVQTEGVLSLWYVPSLCLLFFYVFLIPFLCIFSLSLYHTITITARPSFPSEQEGTHYPDPSNWYVLPLAHVCATTGTLFLYILAPLSLASPSIAFARLRLSFSRCFSLLFLSLSPPIGPHTLCSLVAYEQIRKFAGLSPL